MWERGRHGCREKVQEGFMKKRDKVIGIIIGVLFLFEIAGCAVLSLVPDVAEYDPISPQLVAYLQ